MMRNYYLKYRFFCFGLTILFMSSQWCLSQEDFRDSVKTVIADKARSEQFKILHQLEGQKLTALQQAVIANQIGLLFQYDYELDSALNQHTKALFYAVEHSPENQEIGVSLNKIGIIYYYRGQLDSAILFFDRALPYYEDDKLTANSLNNLALMYKSNSNFDKSIEHYLNALDIYQSLEDEKNEGWVQNNIGALYIETKDYDRAIEYLVDALKIGNAINLPELIYSCKSNLASAYQGSKSNEDAIELYREVIDYYESTEQYEYVIVNMNNMAKCYSEAGQKDKSLNLYLKTKDYMDKTGLFMNKDAILVNIGSSYEEEDRFDLALTYYQQALDFAVTNQQANHTEIIYQSIASVYAKMDEMDSSLFYKDLQIALKDSLDQVQKETRMLEFETKHQTAQLNEKLYQTKNELKSIEKERTLFSKGLWVTLGILILTSSVAFYFYKRYRRKHLLSENFQTALTLGQATISELEDTLKSKGEELAELNHGLSKKPYPKHLTPLTTREKEVLIAVQEGLKDVEIAEKLFISAATVRTHLRKAYVKIDVRNRAEAIRFITAYEL